MELERERRRRERSKRREEGERRECVDPTISHQHLTIICLSFFSMKTCIFIYQ